MFWQLGISFLLLQGVGSRFFLSSLCTTWETTLSLNSCSAHTLFTKKFLRVFTFDSRDKERSEFLLLERCNLFELLVERVKLVRESLTSELLSFDEQAIIILIAIK